MMQVKDFLEWDRDVVFFSDRNASLIDAVHEVFPGSAHCFCLVHLRANLRKHLGGTDTKFKNHLIGLFNKAAYAPNAVSFDKLITELKELGGSKVVDFLDRLPNANWCHAYFPGKRYGELTNNLVESFNSWIKNERFLPITQLFDKIRLKLMEQMANRREIAMKLNTGVCPVMDKRITDLFHFSRSWTVSKSSLNLYEVHCRPSVTVDFELRTCSCSEWQINCFPCVHAICALKRSGRNVSDYVDRYYLVECYREAYSKGIIPVPSLSRNDFVPSENDILLPPLCKRPPGRPRTERISSMGARIRQVTCGRCGNVGQHNRASCKEPLI